MRPWRVVQILLVGGALSLVTLSAFAATNTVPPTNAAQVAPSAITANALKPPECAAITLTTLVAGSGTINGGNPAELIVGGAGADTISAGKLDDCVVSGGGVDAIDCGAGVADIAVTGAGTDTNTGGRCETFIQ